MNGLPVLFAPGGPAIVGAKYASKAGWGPSLLSRSSSGTRSILMNPFPRHSKTQIVGPHWTQALGLRALRCGEPDALATREKGSSWFVYVTNSGSGTGDVMRRDEEDTLSGSTSDLGWRLSRGSGSSSEAKEPSYIQRRLPMERAKVLALTVHNFVGFKAKECGGTDDSPYSIQRVHEVNDPAVRFARVRGQTHSTANDLGEEVPRSSWTSNYYAVDIRHVGAFSQDSYK